MSSVTSSTLLPSITSDSACSYHGHALNIRVGLTHDSCLLFDPSDISLVRGTTTGLVGINGSGKSSLAKTIAQKNIPNFPQHLSIQYVSSHENYDLYDDVHGQLKPEQYMAVVLQQELSLLGYEIEKLEESLEQYGNENAVEDVANRLAELYDAQEALEASFIQDVKDSIDSLGFDMFLDMPLSHLSCGWRYKCRLVAAFASSPDILIIDEPSFLDHSSTEWLIQKTMKMAKNSQAMVLIISHKEALLDVLCDRILYINSANHSLTLYNFGYSAFKDSHEADIDHAAKTIENFDTKLKAAESSLKSLKSKLHQREKNTKNITTQNADKRFIKGKNQEAKQKADKSAASKLKKIKGGIAEIEEVKYQAKRELVKPLHIQGTCSCGNLLQFQEVSFAYSQQGHKIFDFLDATIAAEDRILISGENGCGKSTFLKLALGDLEPTSGTIRRNVQALYFAQTSMIEMASGHSHQTAVEYLGDEITQTEARHHLGDFGIADAALRCIASLSTGQKVRLWFAKEQLRNPHPSLLILDEASENLDPDTRNSLLDLLNTFVGAAVVVSHDEDFCRDFKASQTWTIHENGRISVDYA
jgi:ATP-binding cassette, subfamily F, member 3